MIRRFTILLSVFVTTFNVYGQYQPMAVEGAHWVVFDKDDNGVYHHALKIEGDTTVNGNMYKKLYRVEIQSDAIWLPDFLPPYHYTGAPQLVGLIRDEEATKSVYGIIFTTTSIECTVGEEELIHDFSLLPGAYLQGCLHEYQGIPFAGIDSIKTEVLWGKQREVQYVSTGYLYRFIEGIGGNAGPFSSSASTVPGVLTELVEYCVGTDAECGLGPVGTNEAFGAGQLIFPNPTSEYLKIEVGHECAGGIYMRLHDTTGKAVREMAFDCGTNPTMIVNTNDLSAGVYFLTIRSGNRASSHKILVR